MKCLFQDEDVKCKFKRKIKSPYYEKGYFYVCECPTLKLQCPVDDQKWEELMAK